MYNLFLILLLLYSAYRISRKAQADKTARARRSEGQQRDPKSGYREAGPGAARNDERHYARVLGLQGPSTPEDIRKKYRELVAQYHPDKVSHLGSKLKTVAEEEMKKINEAYDFFKKRYSIN